MSRHVDCPTCGKPIAWSPQSAWRPFCSERCKLIDLGDWAAERHVIAGGGSDVTEEGAPENVPHPPASGQPPRRH